MQFLVESTTDRIESGTKFQRPHVVTTQKTTINILLTFFILGKLNSKKKNVKFQFLSEGMNMIDFWDVAPSVLVEIHRRFRYAYYLHHQGDLT
jgi:hypothetical protein